MKISLFTVVAAVLGLAAGHAAALAADIADMPLAAAAAKDGGGPQKEFAFAGDTKAPAATVPTESAPASDTAAPVAAAVEASQVPAGPWHLPEPQALKDLGIEQYGWVEQGVTFNSLSPTNRWNGPVACNDRSNEYEMNQLWLGWERKVKTDGCGWDIGGRIDLMYGSDWRYGECNGLETNLDAPNHLYGFILPQFYMEVGYNDLTVKMGHFAPSIGYEVVAAPGNFFYSHSYALAYSEPVLVSGFQADYKLNEFWNVIGGLNEGFNQFQDENGKFDFLGGLKWHNDEHKVSVSLMTEVGPQVNSLDPLGLDNQYEFTLVLKKQLSEKLAYAFEQTFGVTEENSDPKTFGPTAKWYGLDQYLFYTINPCWSAGARVEWFRDQDGTRVGGVGNANYGWMALPGFAGTFTEVTLGLNWHPNPNIVVRPEARWDAYSGSPNLQDQLPFGDGTRSSQFLFATDLIFSF